MNVHGNVLKRTMNTNWELASAHVLDGNTSLYLCICWRLCSYVICPVSVERNSGSRDRKWQTYLNAQIIHILRNTLKFWKARQQDERQAKYPPLLRLTIQHALWKSEATQYFQTASGFWFSTVTWIQCEHESILYLGTMTIAYCSQHWHTWFTYKILRRTILKLETDAALKWFIESHTPMSSPPLMCSPSSDKCFKRRPWIQTGNH